MNTFHEEHSEHRITLEQDVIVTYEVTHDKVYNLEFGEPKIFPDLEGKLWCVDCNIHLTGYP